MFLYRGKSQLEDQIQSQYGTVCSANLSNIQKFQA